MLYIVGTSELAWLTVEHDDDVNGALDECATLVCERAVYSCKIRLKTVAANTHPCFIPFVTGKGSDEQPFSMTLAIIPSWNDLVRLLIVFTGHPSFFRMDQCPVLLTVSKAFVKSTKKR